MNALMIEALPSGALGLFAVAIEELPPVVERDVVLPRYVENLLRPSTF